MMVVEVLAGEMMVEVPTKVVVDVVVMVLMRVRAIE